MSDPVTRLNAALEGRYRIERELGEGGMATVYLAHDVRHNRNVALKVLKPELAAVIGGERFLVEIQTTANLQHPHILPLFDSGADDGFLYYVMPFVEGESLREKLDREKQLPVDEAVQIACYVAEALDYAHRNEVIHRDIKPANILLHDGNPVVADFGIALALSAAGGGRMTETGLSLGTPHYMSPEQAAADRVLTAKSDVYSLACVLYEMLAGQPPHTGATAQATLLKILTEDPKPVADLRRSVPPHVASALAKALEKLPADRFDGAEAFSTALTDQAFTYVGTTAGAAATAPASTAADEGRGAGTFAAWIEDGRSKVALGAVVVTVLGLVLSNLVGRAPTESVPAATVTRFEVGLGELAVPSQLALSPDGSMLVFVSQVAGGTSQLYLRRADESDIRPIPDTEGAGFPFFSPDGEWLGFVSSTGIELMRMPATGGRPSQITRHEPFIGAPHWGEDGNIVFMSVNGLYRVPFTGGAPEQILGDASLTLRTPHLLPHGRAVLFTYDPTTSATAGFQGEIRLLDLETNDVKTVVGGGLSPLYLDEGYILYVSNDQAMFVVPFDLETHEITGPSTPVLDLVGISAQFGSPEFAISATGTAVYSVGAGGAGSGETLVFLSFEGQEESVNQPVGDYSGPRMSPDGRRLVFEESSAIYIYDPVLGSRDLFAGDQSSQNPLWSPDGSTIVYARLTADGAGWDLYSRPADLSGPAEALLEDSFIKLPWAWTPDGSRLIYLSSTSLVDGDLMVLDLDSTRTTSAYLRADWQENAASLSPNGRWAAYESNEEGQLEVYVRAFPDPAARYKISLDGGLGARWGPDGDRLFYRHGDTVMVAHVEAGDNFQLQSREVLFVGPYIGVDPRPDGQGFVAIKRMAAPSADDDRRLYLVVNWVEELKARTGGND